MLLGVALRARTLQRLGRTVSARMASASAQKEIDEPTGKFFRARNEIAYLELLA
jgi:hypothetical protein